jgi:hypothetical protein
MRDRQARAAAAQLEQVTPALAGPDRQRPVAERCPLGMAHEAGKPEGGHRWPGMLHVEIEAILGAQGRGGGAPTEGGHGEQRHQQAAHEGSFCGEVTNRPSTRDGPVLDGTPGQRVTRVVVPSLETRTRSPTR